MLQRLFSRNVPEGRVSDALEHSNALEERDALRERSAVILGRLERRQEQSRRAEIAASHAARESAERVAKETEAAAVRADEAARAAAALGAADEAVAEAPEITDVAEDVVAYEAQPVDEAEIAYRPLAAPVEEPEYAEPEEDLPETAPETAFAPETAPFVDAPVEEPVEIEPEEAFLAPAEDEIADGPDAAEDIVEAAAPVADEPEVEYRPMVEFQHDYDDDDPEEDFALSIDADEQPAVAEETHAPAGDFFAEETSLYSDEPVAEPEPAQAPAMDFDQDDHRMILARGSGEGASASADGETQAGSFHDDDDVYEQIRRKADEARARIARRLEQMKADEEASHHGRALGRIDLGASTPPLSPRMSDEAED